MEFPKERDSIRLHSEFARQKKWGVFFRKEVTTDAKEKAQIFKQSIRAKREMLEMYAQEIEQLEARAANLKGAAEAIEAGIAKAEAQLRKLK